MSPRKEGLETVSQKWKLLVHKPFSEKDRTSTQNGIPKFQNSRRKGWKYKVVYLPPISEEYLRQKMSKLEGRRESAGRKDGRRETKCIAVRRFVNCMRK